MESKAKSNPLHQTKKLRYIIIGIGILCALIITIVSIYVVNYSPRSKDERAIKAVMTSLLTCPDVELTQLMELNALKVGPGFVEEPSPDNVERFNSKMKAMFGAYLSENALDYIKTSALRYHSIAEENGYKMLVDDIKINQDDKESRNYTFTLHLQYTSPNIEEKQLVVSGRAQCLEVGKITFLSFSDDFFMNEIMYSS